MDLEKVKQDLDPNIIDVQKLDDGTVLVKYRKDGGSIAEKKISITHDYTGKEDEFVAAINHDIKSGSDRYVDKNISEGN